ncbi:MAG: restriction endonuclease [Patescibacteria group bacterium]
MNHLITITKADGTRELFEESKLVESLKNAGGTDAVIEDVIDHVGKDMWDGMPTSEIYSRAFKLLRTHSLPLAVRYSLRRALSELGPEGFPFEKYVAKIFEAWGYETLTDQTVLGKCVPHEMDVIAWSKEKLIMVEAKFHNELALKSDVKVALYIKARFDDLKGNYFDYGGIKRTLTEGWLVTNTKFTEQAIHYGECNGIKMIGWNYPQKGNLQDIIEELHLHPSTCLTTLSQSHKKELLEKGLVLCKDILKNPLALSEVGIKEGEMEKVVEEARQVCGIQ